MASTWNTLSDFTPTRWHVHGCSVVHEMAFRKGEWTHVAVTVAKPGAKINPRGPYYEVCFVINGKPAGCSSNGRTACPAA